MRMTPGLQLTRTSLVGISVDAQCLQTQCSGRCHDHEIQLERRYPLLMHMPTTVMLPNLFSIITLELQHKGYHALGKKCPIGLSGFSNPVSENLVAQVSGNRAIPISFHIVLSLRRKRRVSTQK